MKTLTFTKPDDWHIHLRDGDALQRTVAHASFRFGRAIVMPNLRPAVTNVKAARSYQTRILEALPKNSNFQPLLTLYLTENTTSEIVQEGKKSGLIYGCKLYPASATTNSEAGVKNIENIYSVLEAMESIDLPLLIHGEVVGDDYDIFDREKIFLEKILSKLVTRFPKLRIVLEHITTREARDFILQTPSSVAATLTAHHLLLNRNALLQGGIRPHLYCLPILKRRSHQEALIEAAVSGNPKFFLGTDSAPHSQSDKECAVGCAGIYTAHAAIELYAEVFEAAGALDKLEGFASFFGADFYGLPRNMEKITLVKEDWVVPDSYSFGGEKLVPFRAGEKIGWKVKV